MNCQTILKLSCLKQNSNQVLNLDNLIQSSITLTIRISNGFGLVLDWFWIRGYCHISVT